MKQRSLFLASTGCLRLVAMIFTFCLAHRTSAMTLEYVLQTTLEKNPAIQEAKAGLEQATGQRARSSRLCLTWLCRRRSGVATLKF